MGHDTPGTTTFENVKLILIPPRNLHIGNAILVFFLYYKCNLPQNCAAIILRMVVLHIILSDN